MNCFTFADSWIFEFGTAHWRNHIDAFLLLVESTARWLIQPLQTNFFKISTIFTSYLNHIGWAHGGCMLYNGGWWRRYCRRRGNGRVNFFCLRDLMYFRRFSGAT